MTEAIAPDRADIALDPVAAADKRLLTWIARSGSHAAAEVIAIGQKSAIIYVLSGISSRSISAIQSQDGAGRTSLLLVWMRLDIRQDVDQHLGVARGSVMGHTQDDKAKTKEKILSVASRRFREGGLNSISIADVMNEAGLTHGGFYKHFHSREDLVAKAVHRAAAEGVGRPVRDLEAFIDNYLSTAHRDSPGCGCAFTALAADIARADSSVRVVFTEQLRLALRRMASLARATNEDDSAGTAMFRLSAMLGALTLARAVDDPELSEALMLATRNTLKAERRRAAPRRAERALAASQAAR